MKNLLILKNWIMKKKKQIHRIIKIKKKKSFFEGIKYVEYQPMQPNRLRSFLLFFILKICIGRCESFPSFNQVLSGQLKCCGICFVSFIDYRFADYDSVPSSP